MNLRIAIAQINLLVGAVESNAQRIGEWSVKARDELKADVVVFPELSLTGYPPEDLLLRPQFIDHCQRALLGLAAGVVGIDMVVGFPEKMSGRLFNSAAILRNGEVHGIYRKQALPNYGVFDEKRYFAPGSEPCLFDLHGVAVGLTICEDIWIPGAVEQAAQAGAQLILNINASPFHANKGEERERVVRERVTVAGVPLIYVNLVGAQDELVFDGGSFAMGAAGELTTRARSFEEALFAVDLQHHKGRVIPIPDVVTPLDEELESLYKALVLGVRDYVTKNGFRGAVLGLSGGIDSALTLALAVDALGVKQVEAVLMPSRYTAAISIEDAKEEAEILGVEYHIIPIESVFQSFLTLLEGPFQGRAADTTEENIQARCRGILLMAISNKKGSILLTTGNKSEMSVGYATLYGDMAGGFAPIKDVPKLLVYRLAEYRNRVSQVIPQRVLERPPSAELAPDQRDDDSLPPYAVLDPILARYVEEDRSVDEIIAEGFSASDVLRVAKLVDRNEYKRRQAPPGVKISRRAFGRDRRYPITRG